MVEQLPKALIILNPSKIETTKPTSPQIPSSWQNKKKVNTWKRWEVEKWNFGRKKTFFCENRGKREKRVKSQFVNLQQKNILKMFMRNESMDWKTGKLQQHDQDPILLRNSGVDWNWPIWELKNLRYIFYRFEFLLASESKSSRTQSYKNILL